MLDALQVKFSTFPATAFVMVTRVPLTMTLSETAVSLVRVTVGVGAPLAKHSKYPVAPVMMAHSVLSHRRLLVIGIISGGSAYMELGEKRYNYVIADYIQFCNGHCIASNPSMILSYQNDLVLGQRELKGHSNSVRNPGTEDALITKQDTDYWPICLKLERKQQQLRLMNFTA